MGSPIATGFGKTVVQGSQLLTYIRLAMSQLRAEDKRDVLAIRMRSSSEPSTQEVLAGLVERVTFHNAENGFCVLRAKARGHRDLVTVVGHAAIISAGEWITASGEWINDRAHGQQFKARFLEDLGAEFDRRDREISGLRHDPGHRAGLRQEDGQGLR